ncbi:MAG: metalloregulator ArsR/SmtB family transcription factor [Sphingomicrobium sp.]
MSGNISPDRAVVFAALGDATRLGLIERLADGEDRSIQQLAAGSPLTRQAMTKHLRVLEDARLVRSTRYGREVRFRLEQEELQRAQAFLVHVARQWSSALKRLGDHITKE